MRGQAAMEYVVLFVAIAILTILGVTRFDERIKGNLQQFFLMAAEHIAR